MVRRAVVIALVSLASGCATEAANGRPWVRHLRLDGVQHVDKGDLESKIATQPRSWVPLSPKHYLDPFTVDIDRKRIEAYYQAHGYFGAQVTDAEVRKHGDDAVDVQFSVEEGAPTHLDGVELSGLEGVDAKTAKVVQRLGLKKGQTFDYDKYTAEKQRIEGALKGAGYAWAEVNGQVDVDRDTRLATVHLRVTPGPRARFGDLEVIGEHRIAARLLREHAGLQKGARFSADALEELRGRIYNLGLFSSVKVDYFHDAQYPDVANVLVTVREGNFHEVRAGFGFGFESQRNDVHALGQYTKRNFLGGLRTLTLKLAPAYVAIPAVWNIQRQGLAGTTEARFNQPDLFWRTALDWSVGFDLGIDYAYQYYGPRTNLGLHRDFWHEHVHGGLSYNFQYLIFFNTDPTILNNPGLAGRLFGYTSPYRLGWFQEDFALDLRDRPLDASRGGYLGLTVEEGGSYALGAFQYEKLLPDVRGYAPLGSRVVLAARVQFGQMMTQGSLGSPITRRFYLGGPSSHRGFNYDRLSLQVPSGISGVPPIPIGGDQMVLGQFELRVNIVKLFGSWLAAAAFLDAGDVAAPACPTSDAACRTLVGNARTSIDFADLHYATGGGLRYKTVIGTVRFDLGVRLNRLSPYESDGTPNPDPGQRFAFHISVGEAF